MMLIMRMHMADEIIFDVTGDVASITLNRPAVGNAINLDMARALFTAAVRCDQDTGIRAVVLTGAGRMFCAGGDVVSMKEAGDDAGSFLSELAGTLHMATMRLARMSKPLLCLVNGPAAGAGLGMALMGDVVVASRSAHFTAAYSAIGLTPDAGLTWLLPRLIGLRKTQEMLILNQRVDATEALAIGLVSRLVDGDALGAEGALLAEQLAQAPTAAVGVVRALLLESFETGLETTLEREVRAISAAAAGHEGREGVAAFSERRPVRFRDLT